MSTDQSTDLATETAEVLLTEIKKAATTANGRSTEGLESLAKAYATVREAMPKKGSGRSVVAL